MSFLIEIALTTLVDADWKGFLFEVASDSKKSCLKGL